MYPAGHLGVALLFYAPVYYVLERRGETRRARVGGVAVLALFMLPDIDSRLSMLAHRGVTHTVWFVLVVGLLVGAVWALVEDGQVARAGRSGRFGVLVGSLAVASHLGADTLTLAPVTPLYPLSAWTFSLALTPVDSPLANAALAALGIGTFGLAAFGLAAFGLAARSTTPPARGSSAERADPDRRQPVAADGNSPQGEPRQ